MKNKKIAKLFLYIILISFIFSYFIEKSGYYEYNLQTKRNLTEKEIKKFEQDVREGKKVDIVINLTTPEEEIIERVVNRRICSNQNCKTVYNLVLNPPKVEGICDKCGAELIQRKDDTPETVKARLESYLEQTSPLVDYYQGQGNLYSAVVSKTINKLGKDVAEDVEKYIKENF